MIPIQAVLILLHFRKQHSIGDKQSHCAFSICHFLQVEVIIYWKLSSIGGNHLLQVIIYCKLSSIVGYHLLNDIIFWRFSSFGWYHLLDVIICWSLWYIDGHHLIVWYHFLSYFWSRLYSIRAHLGKLKNYVYI